MTLRNNVIYLVTADVYSSTSILSRENYTGSSLDYSIGDKLTASELKTNLLTLNVPEGAGCPVLTNRNGLSLLLERQHDDPVLHLYRVTKYPTPDNTQARYTSFCDLMSVDDA